MIAYSGFEWLQLYAETAVSGIGCKERRLQVGPAVSEVCSGSWERSAVEETAQYEKGYSRGALGVL